MTEEHDEPAAVDSHDEPVTDATVAESATADAHGTADAHATAHDEHGHDAEALGPIDWGLWSYAIVGAVGGVIVIALFLFALGGLPA